ncbi:MAG: DALR domain-containing protein, partial [Bacteroidota bacterium]
VQAWRQKCYDAMSDDFNTPILIAHLFDAVKHINQIKEGNEMITETDLNLLSDTIKAFVYDVLGIAPASDAQGDSNNLDGVLNLLIDLRNQARANKDFATSDKIRDELVSLGIQLKDGKEGTTFSLN